MNINEIVVTNSKVHNLKNVSVKIPKNSLSIITGPSGSGKSSLAFDTIYVEGQRRYIESLSSYARQFLGQHQPPDVESITGLSPAISIDQKSTMKNPRSTVGTITEIFDYMRVLFARIGDMIDPETGEIINKQTPPQIVRELTKLPEKSKLQILCPIENSKSEIKKFVAMGFSKIRIDGDIQPLDAQTPVKKDAEIEVIVDRILIKEGIKKRLTESVEQGLKLGKGIIKVLVNDEKKPRQYSELLMNSKGDVFPDLEPRLFSFNSPIGACPHCNGIGVSKNFDKNTMIVDKKLPVMEGAIKPLLKRNNFLANMTECFLEQEKVKKGTPLNKLPKRISDILWNGGIKKYKYSFKSENSHFEFSKRFPGIIPWHEKKVLETTSERVRRSLEEYMRINTCRSCQGLRLNQYALSTFINKKNIMDFSSMDINGCYKEFTALKLKGEKKIIGEKLIKEIKGRLQFLVEVGLGYLSLARTANTLSGGESQRIRLATQIGSSLSGVLYVLDEPSIGLHQRDNTKLIKTLKKLRDLGNTVLVVEHDEETMLESDYIIDMGPNAGVHGGEVVASEYTPKFLKNKKSTTARYLNGLDGIEVPKKRRTLKRKLTLKGATHNNVENLDVDFYLEGLLCITGVSGSGKSTLLHEILVPACKSILAKKDADLYERDNFDSIEGVNQVQTLIELDQSPIGRTPKSNPATYTGLFDGIRTLYSQTPESQIRGYKAGRFSFNVKGGRCEECEGNGSKKIEMHFLPDVYITCTECMGRRYNSETLSVLYKGKSIADVLDMTIEEAYLFFKNHPKLSRILGTLQSVGLGYIRLGQSATTLSGGEAQRLKLSRELAKSTKGRTLYVLDEPTTGLHFKDIKVLLKAINDLINQGNTVMVIEHNLDVIKSSDYIIDIGPEGGAGGGKVVAQGTPEQVAKVKKSFTGQYLAKALK
jgi:excinuclease ABC subunit A